MSNWPTKKLGEVAEFQKGKLMLNSAVRTEGVIPYILINDLRLSSYSHFTSSNQGTACMPSDTLLVWDGANAGTIGGGLTGFVGSTITKVSPSEEVDPEFLRIFLSSKSSEFNKQVHGAAIPHLNKDFVCNLPIPLPPLKIQKQIVERMDKIVEARKLNDELIQKADELFQSLLHKELNPKDKNWDEKKLGELCDVVGGGTPSREDVQNFVGDIPWVTVKDLHVFEMENTLEHINEKALENSAANLVPAYTVLVATRVGLGKIAISKRSLTFNQDIKGLKPHDEINAYFLFLLPANKCT